MSEVTLTEAERKLLERAVAATINYHSFDAAAETADFDMAAAIMDTNLAASSAGLAVTVESIIAARLAENAPVEVGAYGQALAEISAMRNRHAKDSQEHARKARALARAEAENVRLRDTLARVEALVNRWDWSAESFHVGEVHAAILRDLRAALAGGDS